MSAKLRIICDGRGTIVELDGKTMSKGIEHVKFEHVGADRKPMLDLRLDLSTFRFLPDGRFDEAEKRLSEIESSNDKAGSNR